MTARTWRSPWRIPPDPSPALAAPPEEPAARLAWRAAWRARAFGAGLGHVLARVPGGEPQRAVLARMTWALAASEAFLGALDACGVDDADARVRARLARGPLPAIESWAEAGLADLLMGRALERGLAGLRGTEDARVAVALDVAGAAPESFGAELLAELAQDERNRPCLQILVDRWMAPSVHVFGRRRADDDAVLRSLAPGRDAELGRWLRASADILAAHGLELTDGQRAGVQLPEPWMRPGRRTRAEPANPEHDP